MKLKAVVETANHTKYANRQRLITPSLSPSDGGVASRRVRGWRTFPRHSIAFGIALTVLAIVFSAGAGPNLGRIAVIGDSITQAAGNSYSANVYPQNANRGYRWHLFKQLVDAGATFDFVGSTANNYTSDSQYPSWRGAAFNRCNEGHFGWRAWEILGGPAAARLGSQRGTGSIVQWTDDSLGGYTADTATIMIGINDFGDGRTPTQVSNDVAGIVDVLQADNPKVRIHLLELLYVGSGHSMYPALNVTVATYNSGFLAPLATAKNTANSTVSVVSMNNGLPGGWDADNMTVDQVHPNSRGEAFIAGRIAAAMGLTNEWTSITVTNGNFEGGFSGAATTNCKPNNWTLYGTPNAGAVPKQQTDYSIVAESTVDGVATGTTNSGSSYIIAGPADTGIKQTLTDVLTTNRHYLLQASVFSGASALTLNDWGIEVWAGATRVGQANNKAKPILYVAGTATQIGSKLTEVTVEFDANDTPAAIGQPLEIRLISRNNVRYIGFEDVRLSWKPAVAQASKHYKVYVLTGQSNSLGTDGGTEVNKLPGLAPADAQVPFWWHNVSGDIYGVSASAGNSIGNCAGFWKTIRAQPAFTNVYANVANAWGPEIQFARVMLHSGETNIAVIKASRGGGGNSIWSKTNVTDNHMYVHVTNTVISACSRLVADGNTFEIAGLLYLQGESDSAAEQAIAGQRFKDLVDNLRADLPSATTMKGFMLGNIAVAATRSSQEAIAVANPSYLYYGDIMDLSDELVSDNLHHNRKAKLVNGARFAQMVLGKAASFNAAGGYGSIYGQQFGSLAAGNTPLTNLTAVLSGNSPQLQGWSEEPALRDDITTVATNQSAASVSDSGTPAWNITDNDATGAAYFYTRKFTGTQTTNFAASGWVYSLNVRFPSSYAEAASFFLQYGDASTRWLVNVRRDLAGALTASFTTTNGAASATLQAAYDNAYHTLTLRKTGGASTDADLVFDGVIIGKVSAGAIDPALEPGVHFGTRSAAGKAAVNVSTANFSAAPTTPGATIVPDKASAYETGDTNFQFTVTLFPPPVADTPVGLAWSGTADAGVDYTSPPATATVLAGQSGASITLAALNDATNEGPETVVASLASGAGYNLAWPSNASATITEAPADIVTVTAIDATASETGDTGTFTFTRFNAAAALTVNYTVSGTATSGADHVALPGGFTFNAGQLATNLTVTPLDDALYERTPETVTVTISPGAGYAAGSPSNATVTITSDEPQPVKANNTDALNLATSWLGDAPLNTEAPVWNSVVTAAHTVSLGANTTWGGITIADPGGDVALTGAFNLTVNGAINTGTNRNLTLGNAESGTVNLGAAILAGSTVLTWNKTADTSAGSFNSSNAVSFTGTLRLRGSTPSTAPGVMQGATGRFWLHSSLGSQAAGTVFFLDTGAAANNAQDFIIGDWNTNGSRLLTLSGLTGFGTIRTDAGNAGTRTLIVDQSGGDTVFNGMLLSHTSTAGAVRSIAFEKRGGSSLTLANIVGKETASAGAANADIALTVTAGTLVLAGTNTTTGAATVNGGTLAVNGVHPASSVITVAAGGALGGTGLINSAVTNNGTLSPGFPFGTLTIPNAPVMNGVALLPINRTNAPNCGRLVVSNTLAYGGTLTVTNAGPAGLANGDAFVLFSAPGYSGQFAATNLPPLASGLGWLWTATNGTLSVVTTVNPMRTNLTASVGGGQLTLAWPEDHTGWWLEVQTNTLAYGLNLAPTNWFRVSGSASTNTVILPVDAAQPAVFYRLAFP